MTSTAPAPDRAESRAGDRADDRATRGRGLGRTTAGLALPSAYERVRDRAAALDDRVIGWLAPLALTALAFFLRVWHLGTPRAFSFDETYYAKDAWSLLHFGYAREYVEKANEMILAGDTGRDLWKPEPELAVHPEVGKWMIAIGEKAFGMDPFGWRISAAVVGALMVLVMCRLARRLTGSTLLGCVAGLVLAFDGLQLVLSRLALLDIFQAFWLLCAVAACVNDRDQMRNRLARDGAFDRFSWGAPLLWRPWLFVAGVCFGLSCGTKWGSVVFLAVFGLLVWVWAAGARRSFGVRWALPKSLLVDAPIAFAHLVLVAFVVYVATWTGWLMHANVYEQHLSNTQYTTYAGGEQWPTATEPDAEGLGEVTQSLDSLWHYHRDVWVFHTHFLDDAEHDYESQPRGWPLLNRPVGVDAQNDIEPGDRGCQAPAGSEGCLKQVLLLGNPVVWWSGVLALLYAVAAWVGRRDWRFGLCVVGFLAGWLPWFSNDDRPIFAFYAINMLPFTVLAITLLIGRLISPPGPSLRRTGGVIVAGSFVVLTLLAFAWFWPIWTDQLITRHEWSQRMWFARWI